MTAARSVVVVFCVVGVMTVVTTPVSGVAPSAAGPRGAAATPVAGAPEPSTPSRTDATCPHADQLHFGRERYVEQRGDVARLALLFTDSVGRGPISLRVAAEDGPRVGTAALEDGNGDGRFTLLVDTDADRPEAVVRAAAAADAVRDRNGTAFEGPVATGTYSVSLLGSGCAQDHTDLVVEERRPVALTAYRGSRGLLNDTTSAADVREALAVGDLHTPREGSSGREGTPLLRGETLALELDAPALAEALADAADPATRFRATLGRQVTVDVGEARSSVGSGESFPEHYDLSAFDWQVYPDVDNDTVYLLLDTRSPFAPSVNATDYGAVGERYVVTATVGDDVGTTAFEFAEPAADVALSGILEEVLVTATTDATVTGTTTLPNGTTLTVALRSDGASPSTTREVTAEDGRFEVTFDLAGVESGTRFEAFVTHGGAELDRDDGRVRPSATVSVSAVDGGGGDRVRVDTAALSDGGFVVVHSRSDDGPVVGTSAYLPPGSHTNLTVSLDDAVGGTPSSDGTTLVAVAHHDRDGDRQFDPEDDDIYRRGGPEDAVQVLVVTPTETAGGTPASPATADAPPTATAAPTDARPPSTSSTTPDSGPIPGFGPVAALAGLVVAALVAAAATSRTGRSDR